MESNRAQNDISYALYEELEGRLRVELYAESLYISINDSYTLQPHYLYSF